ncbi:unnamed protein product, partial [Acidithrix sp. C25]
VRFSLGPIVASRDFLSKSGDSARSAIGEWLGAVFVAAFM